jgi:hypothetical protein
MSVMDDYQDDMSSMSSADIEAMLSGGEPESQAIVAVGRAVADIRRSLERTIAPEVASTHLTAMARALRPTDELTSLSSARRGRHSMRSKTRRRAGIIALAAALVMGGGLAAAVTLPSHANDHAKQATPGHPAGKDLPSQSDHGQSVSDLARNTSLTGCEKGQAIAEAASAWSFGHRQNAATRPDPCTASDANGAGSGGAGPASGSGGGSGGPGGGSGSGGGSGVSGSGSGGGSGGPGGGSGSGGGSGVGGGGSGGGSGLPGGDAPFTHRSA